MEPTSPDARPEGPDGAARSEQSEIATAGELEESAVFCRACGSRLTPEKPFCPTCGASVNGDAPVQSKRNDKGLLACMVSSASNLLDRSPVPKPVAIGGVVAIIAVVAVLLARLLAPYDFRAHFDEYANEDWCYIADDGSAISIVVWSTYFYDEWGMADDDDFELIESNVDSFVALSSINHELGFPDSMVLEMLEDSSGFDAAGGFRVAWEVVDDGVLTVTYARA